MTYKDKYNYWLSCECIDGDTKRELKSIKDENEIEDRFYKDLEFGTGGLRGVIGAGTNRMNVYTVGKATQGLANYLNSNVKDPSVCIAYDSRLMSKDFAQTAAYVLCANGIHVKLFDSLRPTPMLSFAVRFLKCSAGIVITASHNPKQYNGYKVYGSDGGQVTDSAAKEVFSYIEEVKDFADIKTSKIKEDVLNGMLEIIGESVDAAYIDKVKNLVIRKEMVEKYASELKIIYTPLHGSGNIPVRRVLKELGFKSVNIVKEQEEPDGNFPTVSYPNPENPDVFKIALKMSEQIEPDIIFGTDPDSDRIGVVVKNKDGEYKVLTGNQTGALLMHYIISSLNDMKMLPENGAVIKTIVTTDIAKKIASDFNVSLIEVLTGFKYIGEKIKEFNEDESKTFLFGFEESYGYLSGEFVRDKDAVIAATLICEMALYYKRKNMNLFDALLELYSKYGFYSEELVSLECKGKEGQEQIGKAMDYLRHSMSSQICGRRIAVKEDYKIGISKDIIKIIENNIELPKSNVLKFIMEDGSWFVARPSGTEPKMKIYISAVGDSMEDSHKKLAELKENVMSIINVACNQ